MNKTEAAKFHVAYFGTSYSNDAQPDKMVYGGKGAGLMHLSSLQGVLVPPGFIIPTDTPRHLPSGMKSHHNSLRNIIEVALKRSEILKKPGSLVSVRSGAPVSMPGMMDTVLNVGITEQNLPDFVALYGVEQAYRLYARFLSMYLNIVCGIDKELLQSIANNDASYKTQCSAMLNLVLPDGSKPVIPETPLDQITNCALAVFKSWNSPRAIEYRKLKNISNDMGTAVVVQTMVFGNSDPSSCTGVVFTVDVSTGDDAIVGEYLPNAQGEDVVSGENNAINLDEMPAKFSDTIHSELVATAKAIHDDAGFPQDIEFTVDSGILYILQTRDVVLTDSALIKYSTRLLQAGEDLPQVQRVRLKDAILRSSEPSVVLGSGAQKILVGLGASSGIRYGRAVFGIQDALELGDSCVLFRHTTVPDDVEAMSRAAAVVTLVGGFTSHGAIVARSLGKPCVVGAELVDGSKVQVGGQGLYVHGKRLIKQDALVAVDGSSGAVYLLESEDDVSFEEDASSKQVLSLLLEQNTSRTVKVIHDSSTDGLAIPVETTLVGLTDTVIVGVPYAGLCGSHDSMNGAEKVPLYTTYVRKLLDSGKNVAIDLRPAVLTATNLAQQYESIGVKFSIQALCKSIGRDLSTSNLIGATVVIANNKYIARILRDIGVINVVYPSQLVSELDSNATALLLEGGVRVCNKEDLAKLAKFNGFIIQKPADYEELICG